MVDDQRDCISSRPPSRQVYNDSTGTRAEWARWWIGYWMATPFYAVADLGLVAERVGHRIVNWSEEKR